MDGKIDEIREALNELQGLIHHIERTTGHEYDSRKLHAAFKALSTIDPDAIRREFWDELHAEAETQYDRRLELLGPIETLDDAAFRKTLGDGWSAWLLAKKIIENRRAVALDAARTLPMRRDCERRVAKPCQVVDVDTASDHCGAIGVARVIVAVAAHAPFAESLIELEPA